MSVVPPDGASPAPGIGYDPTSTEENTDLQTHVAFFDTDADGIIWPLDTFVVSFEIPTRHTMLSERNHPRFRGFRDLGFGYLLSFLSMCIIHGGFS